MRNSSPDDKLWPHFGFERGDDDSQAELERLLQTIRERHLGGTMCYLLSRGNECGCSRCLLEAIRRLFADLQERLSMSEAKFKMESEAGDELEVEIAKRPTWEQVREMLIEMAAWSYYEPNPIREDAERQADAIIAEHRKEAHEPR
jgi:hypothetical protein